MQTQQAAVDITYGEIAAVKRERLLEELNELTEWHAQRCEGYRRILQAAYGGRSRFDSLDELPALPVRLFKTIDLVSVPPDEISKILTSSGTTSQRPSRIFLDKQTAVAQSRALMAIMKSLLGSKRLPMAILDGPSAVQSRDSFSARGAGILGFSQFGYDHTYLLDDAM